MINIIHNSNAALDIIDFHPNLVMFTLNKHYQYIAFNDKHANIMKNIWGKDIELDKCMLDYVTNPFDIIKAKANFDRALSGSTFTLLEQYGEEELNRLYFRDTYYPLYNAEKEIYGLCVVVEDVTISQTKKEEVSRIISELEDKIKWRSQELEQMNMELLLENQRRLNSENELKVVKKQVEKALANEMELNKLKNKFISMVSHEFRTPLTIIQTASFLLEKSFERKDEEKFHKNLYKVSKSIDTMTDLMESVLNIGKLEHGEIKVSYSVFNIKSELKDIVNANKKFHKCVKLKLPEGVVIVESDKILLTQIINNLLSNAIKYSEPYPKIKLKLKADVDKCTIIVTDNGIGIAKENIGNITDPFKREDKISSLIQGTGLGLSIVKYNLELINGSMTIESEIDIGTTVTIIIPR